MMTLVPTFTGVTCISVLAYAVCMYCFLSLCVCLLYGAYWRFYHFPRCPSPFIVSCLPFIVSCSCMSLFCYMLSFLHFPSRTHRQDRQRTQTRSWFDRAFIAERSSQRCRLRREKGNAPECHTHTHHAVTHITRIHIHHFRTDTHTSTRQTREQGQTGVCSRCKRDAARGSN